MHYVVCQITSFFNNLFLILHITYMQSRALRKLLWANNEQIGEMVFIYISNRSTHQTNPAFGCCKGPRQPCECAVPRWPGLFLRGSQRESLWLENHSQQSDMRACSHLRCSSEASLWGFQLNDSLHSLACTIDQPSYFNKLSPFLIVSSLLCAVLSSAAFLANDEIFQYHSPCNLYVNNKKWVSTLLPAAFTN